MTVRERQGGGREGERGSRDGRREGKQGGLHVGGMSTHHTLCL